MSTTAQPPPQEAVPRLDQGGRGGHPRGLNTLFFTEMWERFSYYGMRALLILFMTAPAASGGMAMGVESAGRVYGLYTAAVYFAALPGGFLADRFLGLRRAVFMGGVIIAAGHFSMAIPTRTTFYLGLGLIVLGTGLLKPNISAMVGELYSKDDPRRDGGFSIYYMGINIGALAAPLICGTLGQTVGWHWGFAAAGVGMVFGLIQYVVTGDRLGDAGLKRPKEISPDPTPAKKSPLGGLMWVGGLALIIAALVLEISSLARLGLLAVGSTSFIISLYIGQGFSAVEKRRAISIFFLFWVAALFWSGFEQAGSSLNLFADRRTDNSVVGADFPSTWYQSLNPLYIILLAPLFSMLWIRLGSRQPSSPIKFSLGLLFVGLGFGVMVLASQLTDGGQTLVSPGWLVMTYLLHTIGELCLSPVGLSVMTKLSPARIVGQIMGVWFLAAAIGNYMGGEIATYFEALPLPQLFGIVMLVNLGVAAFVFFMARPIERQMGGVR